MRFWLVYSSRTLKTHADHSTRANQSQLRLGQKWMRSATLLTTTRKWLQLRRPQPSLRTLAAALPSETLSNSRLWRNVHREIARTSQTGMARSQPQIPWMHSTLSALSTYVLAGLLAEPMLTIDRTLQTKHKHPRAIAALSWISMRPRTLTATWVFIL